MKQVMTQCANGAPITFWPHLLTFFADRSLFGVHQFTPFTTYFHSKPTQNSPHVFSHPVRLGWSMLETRRLAHQLRAAEFEHPIP